MYDSEDLTERKDVDDDSRQPSLDHSSTVKPSVRTSSTNAEKDSIIMPTVVISENSPLNDSCITSRACSKTSNADSVGTKSFDNKCVVPSAHVKKNHLSSNIIGEISNVVTT